MTPANDDLSGKGRRRVPRRTFRTAVGILLHGKYATEHSYQVGEGGMMVSCREQKLGEGDLLAVSFFLPSGVVVMVRGVVRAIIPAKDRMPERYGLEFQNLDFQYKREIRNFVAAATRDDDHATS